MIRNLLSILLISIAVAESGCSSKNDVSYKDASLPVEERVEDLLSRMTLDEKIGQLNQRHSWGGDEAMEYFTKEVEAGNIGSILNVIRAEDADSLQRIAMEKSRLGIPLLLARDVIHGYKTVFPIPLGQAATFDTALVKEGARIAAIEASSDGIRWTFAPMMDISRDARWGRIAESFGEDVYLARMMARSMVTGFQGDSLTDATSLAACAKHFVGYGASEGGRDYNSTNITERQMRNIYLQPFEEACKVGCLTYMSSFNDNDGIPASANRHTLTEVLRDDWGFKGFVVSDWGSVEEMVNHGFCTDRKDAAMKALNAGVDMEMESGTYLENMKALVDEGKVSMEVIDRSVANILRVKFELGLFENPYTRTPQDVKYSAANLEAARKCAQEAVIMLKNDNDVLPLGDEVKTILVAGPMADAGHDQLGTWAYDGEKERTQTIIKALRDEWGDKVNIIYEPGLQYSRQKDTSGIAKAVAAARGADAVIVVVGEEAILSGEAHSLADISLVGKQSELIEQLSATGKPVITVIMAGRPLTIAKEVEASSAVLYMFHPGTMGGGALADILFGKVSPSGKTPVSFPRATGQVPMYYCHNNTGRPAAGTEMLLDDIPLEAGQTSLGCTSYWLDAGFGPLFPFGYGLTYGKFEYSDLKLNSESYGENNTITATFRLTNNGKREATEVAQLYVRDMVGSITRPVKELKGFKRVTLAPGESAEVSIDLPIAELAFYGIDNEKRVEPGDFTLWVGGDSDCTLSTTFVVSGK